jgi:Zn-dependent M16 (insulinase) family peptidase
MTAVNDPINISMKPGTEHYGYRLQSVVPLEEINAFLYQLVHLDTGARHVHISTQDKENTFGVTFKTVPRDSTGVAHILEHTVLCGSKKYPVRDPFFSMLKRSLSTFMNAFTASDWTMYPFSTQNPKDYYNLMDVYLDAAFYPDLEELSFKQEGHRVEIETGSDDGTANRLIYKGVVFNEMKGAMSSPDQVMGRSLLNALYPDTTYSNNSGGEPRDIPKLTHAQLKAFHQHHYHPSNAFFYTYGNLPLEKHLAFISEKIMTQFERIDPGTDVPPQPRWARPVEKRYTYPLSPGEDANRKSQVCVAWLTGDVRDTYHVLVMTVLEQILLGNAASPLRKALMDSRLGSALSDTCGFDADNRDTLFACGLKDTDESSAESIEQIIFDVLKGLSQDGIERELIDSAIHQIEFHRKEITNTPYPYGLRLLLTIVSSWLHGGDPERVLRLDDDLARLRQEIDAGPLLENTLLSLLLENPHRVRLVLVPDQQKAEQDERQEERELAERMRLMSPDEQNGIRDDAARLEALQERQEDLSCLPTLAVADIPPDVSSIQPTRIHSRLPVWCFEQPTSGIFYFNGAGRAGVSADLLPWVPFFCYAFTKVGTSKRSYAEMARRIDSVTGGLSMSASARTSMRQPGECLPLVVLNAKCLARNIEPTIDILQELIGDLSFSDRDRLKQLMGEYRAGLESMIVNNGHRLAISLSSRAFSPAAAASELWSGVHQIRTIRQWVDDPGEAKTDRLADTLSAIAASILSPDNLVMASIGEQEQVNRSIVALEEGAVFSRFKIRNSEPQFDPLAIPTPTAPPREGWSTSTAVAFVARTIPTVAIGHADAPTLAVLAKMLRSLYLHREIREKGGAYGGFALYNPENGLFSLASYRDPHIVRTMAVFDGVKTFPGPNGLEPKDITEAVLQVCSEIDKPDPPGPSARKAFARRIVGLMDEERLAFKQAVLSVSRENVEMVVEKYFGKGGPDAGTAVIAGQDHLVAANAQLGDAPLDLSSL